MTKNEDLKACPFCFKDNARITVSAQSGFNGVSCMTVGCFANGMPMPYPNRESAIHAWNTRSTITPTDSAMEDNTGRSGSNGMASVEGSTPSLPNPSTTDGDAEMALQRITPMKGRYSGDIYCTETGERVYRIIHSDLQTIKAALQSTRKPPVSELKPCALSKAISTIERAFWYADKGGAFSGFGQKKIKEAIETLHVMDEGYSDTPPVPVDTINIKREVLQGMMDSLKELHSLTSYANQKRLIDDIIASLDAVLEGE